MNIHEHQAKEILKSFGAPVAKGVAVFSIDEAKTAVANLPGPVWVVKSQIHAGGRGKGTFKELPSNAKGGVPSPATCPRSKMPYNVVRFVDWSFQIVAAHNS